MGSSRQVLTRLRNLLKKVACAPIQTTVRDKMKTARVGEQGQALVELAFVIPLVLLFLFAIIDFGLALNQQNSDTNIANLAVREAAVVGTTATPAVSCGGTSKSTLTAWVMCEATATGAPTPTNIYVCDTAGAPSNLYKVGDPIKVEIQSHFNWLTLVSSASGILGSTLGADATMRMEQGPTSAAAIPFFKGAAVCPSS